MPTGPIFYLELIVYMAVLLVAIGLVSMMWVRLSFLSIGILVRTAIKLGLYPPPEPTDGRTRRARTTRDHNVLVFTRLLRMVSDKIPGEPLDQTRTVTLPLLIVGLPLGIGLLLALWVVPLLLFGYVIGTASGAWSTAAAILAVFAYVGAVVLAWNLLTSATTREVSAAA